MSRFSDRISMAQVDELIVYERDPQIGVAWITLSRPEKLNAMTVPMRERIKERIHEVNCDDEIKVVVLRGEGRAFSSGDELNEKWNQRSPDLKRMAVNEHGRMMNDVMSGRASFSQTVTRCQKIVICQVHGHSLGAAFAFLTLVSDFIIAAAGTRFGGPSTAALGGTYGANFVRTARVLGLTNVRLTSLLTQPHSMEYLQQIGVVSEVVPPEELEARTRAIATELARRPVEEVVLVKSRFQQLESSMGMTLGSSMRVYKNILNFLSQPAEDEFAFWKTVNNSGIKAALVEEHKLRAVAGRASAEEAEVKQ